MLIFIKTRYSIGVIKRGAEMVDFTYVDSESVDQIGYDADVLEAHVIFKKGSRHYIYSNVPADVYESFANSSSKGSFVHTVFIAHGYPYRQE